MAEVLDKPKTPKSKVIDPPIPTVGFGIEMVDEKPIEKVGMGQTATDDTDDQLPAIALPIFAKGDRVLLWDGGDDVMTSRPADVLMPVPDEPGKYLVNVIWPGLLVPQTAMVSITPKLRHLTKRD